MKNIRSLLTADSFNKKTAPALWALLHAGVFLALALCFFAGRKFFVNANLLDILPESSLAKAADAADKALTQKMSRQFFVLAKAKTFKDAAAAAALFASQAHAADPGNEIFESLSFEADQDSLGQILNYYYQNRFVLLDEQTIQKINAAGGIEEMQEEAAQKAFGAFSFEPLEFIEGDPFFLADLELQNLTALLSKTGTAMALRDGVLAAECDGDHYVMVRGALTKKGSAITNKSSGVKLIYACAEKAAAYFGQEVNPVARLGQENNSAGDAGADKISFVFSGTPFHSYHSSSSAQRQVAVISALSMLAVVLLLLFVFRSARPLLFSLGAILLSAAFGLASELLAFGQIHVLTFVFGTTLIGTCLDYSVHFWTRAYFSPGTDGAEIRNKLFKGLSLSFASTEVCYLLMLFAPFSLLKQISVFCFAGILSSFLTTLLFYPKLPPAKKRGQFLSAPFFKNGGKKFFKSGLYGPNLARTGRFLPKIPLFSLALIFLFLAIFFKTNLRLDNDLRKFYTMSGRLLDDEVLVAKVMNRKASACYFIVRGNSQEELFEAEEKFRALLDKDSGAENSFSYSATTQFIPSKKARARSLEASEKLMRAAPDLLELFGYKKNDFAKDLAAAKAALDAPGDSLDGVPLYLKSALDALYVGNAAGAYFSAVLPSGEGTQETFAALADEARALGLDVFFVNKTEDIARGLNRLTKIMLGLLMAAFALLLFILAFFYKPKLLLKIAAVPLFVLLSEAALVAALKIPLGFFSVTGIILVFGLGLDYIIYTVESPGDGANSLAVLLSFLTTALSFGAIALSSFMPVHVFGSVVFIGLAAAWISSRSLGGE